MLEFFFIKLQVDTCNFIKPFWAMFLFYTFWKYQKKFGFLVFSEGINGNNGQNIWVKQRDSVTGVLRNFSKQLFSSNSSNGCFWKNWCSWILENIEIKEGIDKEWLTYYLAIRGIFRNCKTSQMEPFAKVVIFFLFREKLHLRLTRFLIRL